MAKRLTVKIMDGFLLLEDKKSPIPLSAIGSFENMPGPHVPAGSRNSNKTDIIRINLKGLRQPVISQCLYTDVINVYSGWCDQQDKQ